MIEHIIAVSRSCIREAIFPTLSCKSWRVRQAFLAGTLAILVSTTASSLLADYNSSRIRSVEWLVDNSSVIAVVLSEKGVTESPSPRIIRVMKGDTDKIRFPLRRPAWDGSTYWHPQWDGPAQLIFVRGESELLEVVKLARPVPNEDLTLHELTYGVSQFGDLHLTENGLLSAIDERCKKSVGESLGSAPESDIDVGIAVQPPKDFPLETTNDTYQLVVPFDEERRDHYVKMLESGCAAARITAIHQIAYFNDETARRAIRVATEVAEVVPGFKDGAWRSASQDPVLLTAADVQSVAKRVLKRLEGKEVPGHQE